MSPMNPHPNSHPHPSPPQPQPLSPSPYLKYPIPSPIPLSLPNGSALLGLTGLPGLPHLSPLSPLSQFSLTSAAPGTLNISFSPHLAGAPTGTGLPIFPFLSSPVNSLVEALELERDPESGELKTR